MGDVRNIHVFLNKLIMAVFNYYKQFFIHEVNHDLLLIAYQTGCVSMCGQTKISPNGSIFKPEYSGISCIFLKCNRDDKIDTFCEKSKDYDCQEMGV